MASTECLRLDQSLNNRPFREWGFKQLRACLMAIGMCGCACRQAAMFYNRKSLCTGVISLTTILRCAVHLNSTVFFKRNTPNPAAFTYTFWSECVYSIIRVHLKRIL